VAASAPTSSGQERRPLILVSNDDGIHAPGLAVLVEAMRPLGRVVVCAPEGERSGAGHSMTFHTHLRANEIRDGWWAVAGTPVDCVYFGLVHLCRQAAPDLVVSGINAGYNLGSDVFYSGTVGAAAEGHMRGRAGLAVSAERGVDPRWAAHASRVVARHMLAAGGNRLLSVNVPHAAGSEQADAAAIDAKSKTMPFCVTRLGTRVYQDEVLERRDPSGRAYYWIGGPPGDVRGTPGDDLWAVDQGMVSVTPLHMDITAPDLKATQSLLANDPDITVRESS